VGILTTEIIEGFVNTALAHKFDSRKKTPDCHREWWKLCCSDAKNVAIAAPRGHAKSTAITHSYTLATVLFRESKFVMIVSDTEAQAINFLNDIKTELRENSDIIELFEVKRFLKDAETECIVEFADGHRFKIIAKGAEQKIRGTKWDNYRPDMIIIDDLENDELVMNPDRRQKLRNWFYGALVPSRSENGRIRYVGTILHMDSLLERLMPGDRDKFTRRDELRTWSEKPNMFWKSVKYQAHNPDFSKILWKEKFPEKVLKAIRQEFIDQGMPEGYSQEYLNYPLDTSRSYFRKSDFAAMTKTDLEDIKTKNRPVNYYVTADLAISQKERADFSVFCVGAVDSDNNLYICDVIRDRFDSMELVNTILAIHRRYNPELIALEDEKITKAIGPFLTERMLSENLFPNIITVRPSADKQTRARSIQARMRIGSVKFNKEADWYGVFEEELVRFPRDRHDDQVDAIAYMGLVLDKFIVAPTREEQDDEDLEDEYRASKEDDWESGRCFSTGY
jgi:predicted phage terminase large subunit-like protein